MPELLVRVEAVNLDSFVYDTQDISTVRGGGLLLLDMAADLETALGAQCGLTKVFTAGSIGLFHAESGDADTIKASIRQWISNKPALRDATILVEASEISNGFADASTNVQSQIRWSQMQSPTLVYPTALDEDRICIYDRVRPASETEPNKAEPHDARDPVSAATKLRRKDGKRQKQRFYHREAGVPADWNYTHDLEELTNNTNQDMGNLHHKMALIYLDGNKFSGLFVCNDRDELGNRSRVVRANQRSVLHHILNKVFDTQNKVFDTQDDAVLRVETLLWGADEIIWAVPAWLGWWWMNEFFTHYGRLGPWEIEGRTVLTTDCYAGNYPLTHGAAIVFCHHDAPIQRVIQLARNLADWPKEKGQVNTFTYQVLESFDHLGEDAGTARLARIPRDLGKDFYCLPGNNMDKIRENILRLKGCVPKGELHHLVQLLCRDRDLIKEAGDQAVILVAKSKKRDANATAYLDGLANALGMDSRAAWIHLLDLWDYVITPATASTSGSPQ